MHPIAGKAEKTKGVHTSETLNQHPQSSRDGSSIVLTGGFRTRITHTLSTGLPPHGPRWLPSSYHQPTSQHQGLRKAHTRGTTGRKHWPHRGSGRQAEAVFWQLWSSFKGQGFQEIKEE